MLKVLGIILMDWIRYNLRQQLSLRMRSGIIRTDLGCPVDLRTIQDHTGLGLALILLCTNIILAGVLRRTVGTIPLTDHLQVTVIRLTLEFMDLVVRLVARLHTSVLKDISTRGSLAMRIMSRPGLVESERLGPKLGPRRKTPCCST
jgi:hypothetical protein